MRTEEKRVNELSIRDVYTMIYGRTFPLDPMEQILKGSITMESEKLYGERLKKRWKNMTKTFSKPTSQYHK